MMADRLDRAAAGAGAAPLAAFRRALDRLDAVSRMTLVTVMAALVVIVSAQVVARYAFNASIDSAAELSRLAFVWVIFLAIPHGVRRGAHVGIDLLTRLLPETLRNALFRVTSALSLLLMTLVAWQGLKVTADKWGQLMPTLELSAGLFYVPLVLCGVHAGVHLVHFILAGRDAWGEEADDHEEVD